MQAAVEALFRRLVLEGGPGPLDARAVTQAAAESGFSPQEAASLAELAPRFALYGRLVRGTVRGAIELAIPRAAARLGRRFDAYLERFLVERAPASPYLRDVTTEFLDFCEGALAGDPEFPRYLLELARHEALRIRIAAAPDTPRPEHPIPLALDASVRFVEASVVARYEHAVHRLPEDETSREAPLAEPTALFVYRSPDDDVRYLELTPLAASLLTRLRDGQELGRAVEAACADHGASLDQATLAGTAQLLADLAERGALLGAEDRRPAPDAPGLP